MPNAHHQKIWNERRRDRDLQLPPQQILLPRLFYLTKLILPHQNEPPLIFIHSHSHIIQLHVDVASSSSDTTSTTDSTSSDTTSQADSTSADSTGSLFAVLCFESCSLGQHSTSSGAFIRSDRKISWYSRFRDFQTRYCVWTEASIWPGSSWRDS